MMDAHWHDLNKLKQFLERSDVNGWGVVDEATYDLIHHVFDHDNPDWVFHYPYWKLLHDATAVPVDTGWHHHHGVDYRVMSVPAADCSCRRLGGYYAPCTDPDCEWRRHGPN